MRTAKQIGIECVLATAGGRVEMCPRTLAPVASFVDLSGVRLRGNSRFPLWENHKPPSIGYVDRLELVEDEIEGQRIPVLMTGRLSFGTTPVSQSVREHYERDQWGISIGMKNCRAETHGVTKNIRLASLEEFSITRTPKSPHTGPLEHFDSLDAVIEAERAAWIRAIQIATVLRSSDVPIYLRFDDRGRFDLSCEFAGCDSVRGVILPDRLPLLSELGTRENDSIRIDVNELPETHRDLLRGVMRTDSQTVFS